MVLNDFAHVSSAGNKLVTFNTLSQVPDVRIPEYTDDIEVARSWEGTVLCRTSLTGHSGMGIVVSTRPDEIVQAPLYTKYVKKRKEFRVHVAFGSVIDVQEKRRRQDYEGEVDQLVRSYHRGWVYCRDGINEPGDLRSMAIAAVNSLVLDFGAVDIIWNERANQCYVLEVNTAPGLEGSTVDSYADAFVHHLLENNLVRRASQRP